MFFHHEESTEEMFKKMENSGYGALEPAITPDKLRGMCEDDPILMKCYEQMKTYCMRYAHDVFNMMYEQKKLEEFRERGEDTKEMYEELKIIDSQRHNLHEAMMDSVNLVSRELAKRERDNEWMREVTAGGRASYATFAILTFYQLYSTMIKD